MPDLLATLLDQPLRPPKSFGLSSFSNTLMDHTYRVSDQLITDLKLTKGQGAMGSTAEHQQLLATLATHPTGQKVNQSLGGSCCNVARCLADPLLESVSFATNVGTDQAGQETQNILANTERLTSHITTHQGATGSTIVLVSPDGERTMHADLGVSNYLDKHSFNSDDFLDSSIFHFCGYQWGSPSQRQVLTDALHLAQSAQVVVSFDVADPYVAQQYQTEFIQLFDHCQIIFCNESEVLALFGENFELTIHQKWPHKLFAIKRGAQDALIIHHQHTLKVPAYQHTQVIDTTGAGDIFAAGFCKGLLHHQSLECAAHMAHRVAADVISRYGVSIAPEAAHQALKIMHHGG